MRTDRRQVEIPTLTPNRRCTSAASRLRLIDLRRVEMDMRMKIMDDVPAILRRQCGEADTGIKRIASCTNQERRYICTRSNT